MKIIKYDICRKTIKNEKEKTRVEAGFFNVFELCKKCSRPILNLLKKSGLLKI